MKTLANFIAKAAVIFILIWTAFLMVNNKKAVVPEVSVVAPETTPRHWISPVAEPLSSDLPLLRGEEKKERSLPPSSRTTEDTLIARKVHAVNDQWGSLIREAADEHGLDWRELTAHVVIESEGNPRARSKSGARGLMQLKHGAAKDVGLKNVYDPRENIFGGAKYLASLKKQGFVISAERFLAYHDGARGARKFLASGMEPNAHEYVRKVLHAFLVAEKELG